MPEPKIPDVRDVPLAVLGSTATALLYPWVEPVPVAAFTSSI